MIAQFSAAHPLLTTLGLVLGCWLTASLLRALIWIARFPEVKVVPQAPGRASDRRKVS